jgi:signal transduction histidine kinase
MMTTFKKVINLMVSGGIKPSDSIQRIRHIRLANMISISALMNTATFGIFFAFRGDSWLVQQCLGALLIYLFTHILTISGFPDLGRPLNLISGNLVVFYFSNFFRGQSDLELLYFTLSIAPFMYFAWEERRWYFLSILPLVLMIAGEASGWTYFGAHPLVGQYDFTIVRIISIIATTHQIIAGYFYFLHQSVKHEAQHTEYFKKLEVEHQKQLQVQKLSSLGEMAGGVSHEINNPLMVILGKSYSLRKDLSRKLDSNDPSFQNLEKIDAMVHRISRIIKALRNFSRNADQDPKQKINLHELLELTIDLCRQRFLASSIELEVKVATNPTLICRPTEISQVLLNLLNNAFDAVKGRPHASVRIICEERPHEIEIRIEDNGIGIRPEIKDKIMQPFFTTKEIGKGTGLGLSISKGLIESHKGQLNLIDDPQKTIFQILLPAESL